MKKTISILAVALLGHFGAWAQSEVKEKESELKKPSRDFIMLQIHHDGWNVTSDDDVRTKGLGRGFSGYVMYDFPLGNKAATNFSFAAGLGVSANNIYLNKQMPNFKTPDSLYFMETGDQYKSIKYNTAFLEMPLELRYFGNKNNRNKGFKFAIGAKVGLLMNSTVKYVEPINNVNVVNKMSARKFNESWRLSPTVRMGWGNFSVFAQYNVTRLYKLDNGPKIFPYSIGLTITGL